MIGGLKLLINLYILINNVCMLFSLTFYELPFKGRSSNFASSISYARRRVRWGILFI